ncbi:MAG: alpha/beta hydrolase [Peptoniphilus sp.]|nr:alpha/beta hydrolase [Peptoniphilus sp.]MDY6045100.1 alpha/beta hydrolase [Peptoniphilus sp.]
MYRYVNIRGERIAFRKKGRGRVVLMLHGNRSSSRSMEPLMEPLSEKATIYAPDMSGFGESTYHHRREAVADYAEDMAAFLEVLDLREVLVIGWSFGGAVAMELAKLTERVESMVLLSSMGPEGIAFPSIVSTADKYRGLDRAEAKRERAKDMLAESLFDGDLPEAYLHLVEEAVAQQNGLDVYFAMLRYRLADARDIPTLIIHGLDDRVVAYEDASRLSEFYPNSRLKALPGGHFLIYNDCEAVEREIATFMDETAKK